MENNLYCTQDALPHKSDLGAMCKINTVLQWAFCLACVHYFFHLQHSEITVMWKTEEKLFVQVKIIIPSFFPRIMIYVCPVFPFSVSM